MIDDQKRALLADGGKDSSDAYGFEEAAKIYSHIMRENGQAAKRTSTENICDVLAAINAIAKEKK
jgi:hypothetical protein